MASLQTARRWRGLDLFNSAEDIGPEYLTSADNILISGNHAQVRPGKRGQLTTPLGAAVYALLPYIKADASTEVLCVSNGRLYRWPKGTAGAPSEITVSGITTGTIVSAKAMMARLDKYAYLVDGTNPLMRTDLTSGATVLGLTVPPSPPTVAGASTTLDAVGGAWTAETLSGSGQTNRLPNSDWSATTTGGGWASGGGPTGWTPMPTTPDLGTVTGGTGQWLLLDNPGEGAYTTAALANDAVTGDATRFARTIYGALTLWQSDTNSVSSVLFSCLGYSDAGGTNLVAEVVKEMKVTYTGNQAAQTLDTIFDFAGYGTEIQSYRIKLTAGSNNPAVTGHDNQPSLYVKYPVAFPFASALTATVNSAGTHYDLRQPTQISVGGDLVTPSFTTSVPGTVGHGKGASGVHLIRDLTGGGNGANWSGSQHVVLGLANMAGVNSLSLVLAFRQDGSSTRYYTNPFTVAPDQQSATLDISTVPATILAAFRYVELVLSGDFTTSAAGDVLFSFGPILGAGNFAVGRQYFYTSTEVDASADGGSWTNLIESNQSPLSAVFTATDAQAQVTGNLPAFVNASATHQRLYRYGGLSDPGLGVLIATVARTTDTIAQQDPGMVTWNHTTRAFTDNTPDSWLSSSASVYADTGRDAPPTGAQAICAWQNRIWLAVGGRLYASWEVATDNQAGLYFNRVNLPSDPLNSIKGTQFPVGGADNDPIQALIPLAANEFFTKGFLCVLKQRSVWLLSGTDSDNFALQSYLIGSGIGCVAPRAAVLINGDVWFRGPNCIYRFDGNIPDPTSVAIETLLTNNATTDEWMIFHGRRLLHGAHEAGAGVNGIVYLWDSRQDGWTLWHQMNFTSAVSTSTGADTDNLFLGGLDGQIYELTGSGDKATPSAGAVAVAWKVGTRAMGQEGAGGDYWATSQATRLLWSVRAQENLTVTYGIVPAYGGYNWTRTYAVTGSTPSYTEKVVTVTPPGDVRGQALEAYLSGSSLQPLVVVALALETVETGLVMA